MHVCRKKRSDREIANNNNNIPKASFTNICDVASSDQYETRRPLIMNRARAMVTLTAPFPHVSCMSVGLGPCPSDEIYCILNTMNQLVNQFQNPNVKISLYPIQIFTKLPTVRTKSFLRLLVFENSSIIAVILLHIFVLQNMNPNPVGKALYKIGMC